MKKYFLSLFIILFTILGFSVSAEVAPNSGFIPGQIWYSKPTLIDGDIVNIYTAVWNGENGTLSAKVEFYDKNVILGSRDITLAPSELKNVTVPWKITSGDHLISAKITSSLKTVSGKKENIVLKNISTSSDKQFVPVFVKNNQGAPVSGTDELKNQINKASFEINSFVPEQIGSSFSEGFMMVDGFRKEGSTRIEIAHKEVQKELDSINKVKTIAQALDEKSNVEDAVKKPIAYLKLFLLAILSFVFANKIVFYGVLIMVIFYIIRSIHRRI